jgi:haloacetate dehalogenase
MCADRSAGAGPGRDDGGPDRAAGRRIAATLHFLRSRRGLPARTGDPAALRRARAPQVTDCARDCGQFVPVEHPQPVLAAFPAFPADQAAS